MGLGSKRAQHGGLNILGMELDSRLCAVRMALDALH